MHKYILFFLSFLFLSNSSAQTIIEASLINSTTKETIPYASIRLNNEDLRTYSDSVGKFCISCNINDTIFIESIGFKHKYFIAKSLINRDIVKLEPEIFLLDEVSVSVESAYKTLLQARDSTQKHQIKSFDGLCYRDDKLFYNDTVKRKSEAQISFNHQTKENGKTKTDYWLDSLKMETYIKISKQPYLAYPSSIPLNVFSVSWPSQQDYSKMKCRKTTTQKQIIIKVIHSKPNKNLINQATYYINKETMIIEQVDYVGNFQNNPVKQSNRYHYQTQICLTYSMQENSCVVSNFIYELIFSHKKEDPTQLWKYTVNMDIIPSDDNNDSNNKRKLRQLDYLMYKESIE